MFKNVQKDKLLHFILNALITFVLFVVFSFVTTPIISLSFSFIISLIIAAAKELLWDKALKNGVCSLKDFLWGLFGTTAETLSIIVLLFLL